MEEIAVTEEQHEFLEELRQELSEQVVGPYGTVRQRDAVQFLIDNLDDGALSAAANEAASATTSLADAGGGGGDGEQGATDAEGGSAADASDADAPGDADEEDEAATEDGTADPDEAAADDAGDGTAGDDDRLSAMMNLLETHDDKWEQGDSPEARYVVELPDGETEQVKTKDDVKALLFKNY